MLGRSGQMQSGGFKANPRVGATELVPRTRLPISVAALSVPLRQTDSRLASIHRQLQRLCILALAAPRLGATDSGYVVTAVALVGFYGSAVQSAP